MSHDERVLFPSGAFFDALASGASRVLDLERLGFAELRLAFAMRGADGATRSFGIVFDGYELSSAGELEDLSAFDADAVVEGELATFGEMFDNIAAHGGADLHHTFNALTLAGVPLEVKGDDPVRRDRVFRYAETIQQFLDAAAVLGAAPADEPAPARA